MNLPTSLKYWQLVLFFLVCVTFVFVECGSLTMADLGVVSMHEDDYTEIDFGVIPCTDSSSTNQACPSCNIDRLISTPGPFDVWRKEGQTDFHAYYVGGLSYSNLQYSTYRLSIKCVASDGEAMTKLLEVDVIPNAPPDILNWPGVQTGLLDAQNTPADTVIYSMTVTDEETEHLTYKLYTEPRVDYFTIDGYGVIKTSRDLRYAVDSVIYVKVNVSDGRNVVGPFTVTVRLRNVNHRPVIKPLPIDVTLEETVTGGQLIATLTVSDPDPWPVHNQLTGTTTMTPTCTVIPTSESYKFVFTHNAASGGQITLATLPTGEALLDAETVNYYNISCVVNDGYLDSVGQYINLHVKNVNEPPVFDQEVYYCQLAESDAFASSCDLDLTVTDPEHDVITSTFLMAANKSERFRYYDATKRLSFTVDYDIDKPVGLPNLVYLTIVAVDDKQKTGSAVIQVFIYDVNDNTPTFDNSVISFDIVQGQKLGYLGTVTARDNDLTSPFNTVTYTPVRSMQFGSTTRAAVLSNGQIYYTNEFDLDDHGSSYFVYLKAEDGGVPPRSSTATIQLTYRTTTTVTTTTSTSTTTTIPSSTSTATTTTTTRKPYNFFDYPTNVGLFSVLMILLATGVVVGLYYAYQYYTTGHCCGKPSPSPRGNKPSKIRPSDDDDDYYRRRPDTASTASDFDDRDYKKKRNRDYFDDRSRTPQSIIVKVGEYNRSYRY